MKGQEDKAFSPIRTKIYEVIFESDTPAGKFFDIALFVFILLSVLTVLVESVNYYHDNYLSFLRTVEWIFTAFFTVEYVLRLYTVRKPMKYALSFYGIIDFLAILPSYLAFFIVGGHSLMVIRALRLLRVFRIFKLGTFMTQGNIILESIERAGQKT